MTSLGKLSILPDFSRTRTSSEEQYDLNFPCITNKLIDCKRGGKIKIQLKARFHNSKMKITTHFK